MSWRIDAAMGVAPPSEPGEAGPVMRLSKRAVEKRARHLWMIEEYGAPLYTPEQINQPECCEGSSWAAFKMQTRRGNHVACVVCSACGKGGGTRQVKRDAVDFENLPLLKFNACLMCGGEGCTSCVETPCCRCGGCRRIHHHHTAPVGVFGLRDANTFPVVPLCEECHIHYHRVLNNWVADRIRSAIMSFKSAFTRGRAA